MAVLVGDLETENDATAHPRPRSPGRQITTGGACHLDAHMVHDALHEMPLDGSTCCSSRTSATSCAPRASISVSTATSRCCRSPKATTSPRNIPVLFRAADLVLLTKSDLAPHMEEFDASRAERCVRELASAAPVHALSARKGVGLEYWLDWLHRELATVRARRAPAPLSRRPTMITAKEWLDRIRALALPRTFKIMNVAAATSARSRCGPATALPEQIELDRRTRLSRVHLSRRRRVRGDPDGAARTVDAAGVRRHAARAGECAKGEIRARWNRRRPPVPTSVRSRPRSRPCASPKRSAIARSCSSPRDSRRPLRRWPPCSWPGATGQSLRAACRADSRGQQWRCCSSPAMPRFDALVAPGHVATVMGPEEWEFVPEQHDMPAAIAGFRPDTLLAATYSVLRQHLEGRCFLDNCYRRSRARRAATRWRALSRARRWTWSTPTGAASASSRAPASRSARPMRRTMPAARLRSFAEVSRKRVGEMPPGCDCARVVLGKINPNECRLYGLACPPRTPIGPCMVSDEGACRIWWANGQRDKSAATEHACSSSDGDGIVSDQSRRCGCVCGRVQGVGFRPFVYAPRTSATSQVRCRICSAKSKSSRKGQPGDRIIRRRSARACTAARAARMGSREATCTAGLRGFVILESRADGCERVRAAGRVHLRRIACASSTIRAIGDTDIRSSTARNAARVTR